MSLPIVRSSIPVPTQNVTMSENQRERERQRDKERERERERERIVLLSFKNFNDRILLHWQMKDKKINDKRTRGKK